MSKQSRQALYNYIRGIFRNKNCHLYIINGVENHLHMITDLHPSIALADLIKDVKAYSNKFIKQNQLFDGFTGWQVGYSAFTYSYEALSNLINYVQNQEEHHGETSFEEEYLQSLQDNGVRYDPEYVFL